MAEKCSTTTLESNRISVWDSIPLHVWKWTPSEDIRAVVYICHGIGEYTGRYEQLAQVLSSNGILAVGHDHVGHGRSGGERVYIEDFSVYVRDVISHVQDLKAAHAGLPFFLMGHSMGGLIAILVAAQIQNELDGIILSAASIELTSNVAGPLEKIGVRIVARVILRLKLKKLDVALISSIPEEVDEYAADPLVYHDGLKAKTSAELLENTWVGKEKVADITKPVFIMHGGEDGLVPISASEFISNHVGSEDKKFEAFDGNFHEVLHDKDQERARLAIKTWLLSHIEAI